MNISFGTFITNLFFSSILLFAIGHFFKRQKNIDKISLKIFVVCTVLSMLRMVFPVEFFFSYTIGIPIILPKIHSFLETSIYRQSITVIEILIILWFGTALFKGAFTIHKYIQLRRILSKIPETHSKEVDDILSEMNIQKNKVRILTIDVSFPCIVGFINPTILLPNANLSKSELTYILKHELNHYIHHDLWFKAFGELISIIYWWNPIQFILKKQINFITEINNDHILTKYMNERQKLQYLKCMILIAKNNTNIESNFSLSYAEHDTTLLKQRFFYILNNHSNKMNGRKLAFVVLVLFLVSYLFTFEPKYKIPEMYQPYTDLSEYETFTKDGQLYMIKNGKLINCREEIETRYIITKCSKKEGDLYANKKNN